MQRTARQQMQMDMKYGLTTIVVAIDDGAIAFFGKAFLFRIRSRRDHQAADKQPPHQEGQGERGVHGRLEGRP